MMAGVSSNHPLQRQRPMLTGFDAILDYALNGMARHSGNTADHLNPGAHGKKPVKAVPYQMEAMSRAIKAELNITPYPEQIAGALALIDSNLVEMATGEGKTVTLAMAAAYLSKPHLPVHIVTANDYLAARDAAGLAPVYHTLKLSCAAVTSEMAAKDRRAAYQADIVYTTARELLADYLRDQIRGSNASPRQSQRIDEKRVRSLQVLRGVHHVLVDEADHLLIDEAQTPLVISQEVDTDARLVTLYQDIFETIPVLQPYIDYELNEAQQAVNLKPDAVAKVAAHLDPDKPFFRNPNWLYTLIKRALAVEHFLVRDQHYLIRDNKVALIDQATGRVMPNRTFGQGRQSLVEIKEGLPLTGQQQTIGSMGFQRFFRGVPFLAGVSGTLWENRRELWQLYQRAVVRIPTHRPSARLRLQNQLFHQTSEKWQAIAALTRDHVSKGGAVLIGTASVADSEQCAAALKNAGQPHQLLNAGRDEEEAEMVARAGLTGQVTVSTNIAGRGTDIQIDAAVRAAGGLLVIAAQWADSARIDRQLFGRCGRQGDPGQAVVITDLQDVLFQRYLTRFEYQAIGFIHQRIDLPRKLISIVLWRIRFSINRSQRKQRLAVFEQDQWLARHFFSHD